MEQPKQNRVGWDVLMLSDCSAAVALFAAVLSVELWLCVTRDTWNSLGNMTKEEAMRNYIEHIQLVNLFQRKSTHFTLCIIKTLYVSYLIISCSLFVLINLTLRQSTFLLSWYHVHFGSCQILETIPISEEVSELVQKLGNFYTEVDKEEEEKGNESEQRAFTRPFTDHKGDFDDQKYRVRAAHKHIIIFLNSVLHIF